MGKRRETDVEESYADLVAACWPLFRNMDAAAARISILYEMYPEYAEKKLRTAPEFFGPLREGVPFVAERNDLAHAQTALTIRQRVRDFCSALERQAEADMSTDLVEAPERHRDRDRSR